MTPVGTSPKNPLKVVFAALVALTLLPLATPGAADTADPEGYDETARFEGSFGCAIGAFGNVGPNWDACASSDQNRHVWTPAEGLTRLELEIQYMGGGAHDRVCASFETPSELPTQCGSPGTSFLLYAAPGEYLEEADTAEGERHVHRDHEHPAATEWAEAAPVHFKLHAAPYAGLVLFASYRVALVAEYHGGPVEEVAPTTAGATMEATPPVDSDDRTELDLEALTATQTLSYKVRFACSAGLVFTAIDSCAWFDGRAASDVQVPIPDQLYAVDVRVTATNGFSTGGGYAYCFYGDIGDEEACSDKRDANPVRLYEGDPLRFPVETDADPADASNAEHDEDHTHAYHDGHGDRTHAERMFGLWVMPTTAPHLIYNTEVTFEVILSSIDPALMVLEPPVDDVADDVEVETPETLADDADDTTEDAALVWPDGYIVERLLEGSIDCGTGIGPLHTVDLCYRSEDRYSVELDPGLTKVTAVITTEGGWLSGAEVCVIPVMPHMYDACDAGDEGVVHTLFAADPGEYRDYGEGAKLPIRIKAGNDEWLTMNLDYDIKLVFEYWGGADAPTQ